MNRRFLTLLPMLLCLTACQPEQSVRDDIQRMLDQCTQAVSTKNIDLYMEGIPEDFVIYDENGDIISREEQRAYALRDWSIIDTTLRNKYVIDSLQVYGDSAVVFTFQEWERLMFQRDGITKDTVLTTQKHREIWKKRQGRWLNYEVTELGGDIYINGQPYQPE